jgi:membrane protein YqaA with SNARE-associated domain
MAAARRSPAFATYRSSGRRAVVACGVIDSLLATLGLYGATLAVGFIAGMFPIVSIELFLIGLTAWGAAPYVLVAAIAIAAVGHQLAKTLTYYAGAGVFELPRGKLRARIAAARARIEGWRRQRLMLLVAATVGLPPLYVLGFVARPLMKLDFATFTAISLGGRVARYATLVAVAGVF